MSAGVRAIWNASNAVTPRWGGNEQPVAGTTRENQLPSNMVASAKTSVSAQRDRGEDCTGIANAYRVRTRIASRLPQTISRGRTRARNPLTSPRRRDIFERAARGAYRPRHGRGRRGRRIGRRADRAPAVELRDEQVGGALRRRAADGAGGTRKIELEVFG